MLMPKNRTSLSCRTVEGEGDMDALANSGRKNFLRGIKKRFSQTITHVMDKLQARIQRVSSTKRRTVMKNLIDGIEDEQVIEAFLSAINAPYPHRCSPALPIQVAYDYTKLKNESDIEWAYRFVKMDGDGFKRQTGWDLDGNCWSPFFDFCVSGRQIMMDCVSWHQNGWNFSTIPCDYFNRHEEGLMRNVDPNAFKRIRSSLVPSLGEVIRRSWNQSLGSKELMFNFDIWRGNSDWFNWRLILMSEQPVLIGVGVEKLWKLEGFIAPMIVPENATISRVSVYVCGDGIYEDEDEDEEKGEVE